MKNLAPGELSPQKTPEAEETSESSTEDEEEIPPVSVLFDDYLKKADAYFDKKGGIISKQKNNTIKSFVKFCLNERLRQDKYKNSWVYEVEHKYKLSQGKYSKLSRRSWRKISSSQAQKLYSKIREAWELFQRKYEVATRPAHVNPCKWSRRNYLIEIRLPENLWDCKQFLKVTTNLHDEMPAFR